MIIFLSELQKEHLNVIHKHSTQVVVDFCKLVIDYLNNGINPKKYSIAADKLNMPFDDIQNLVQALTYLLVEACQHNLTESDLKSSLAIAGFAPEHQEVLVKLYLTKKAELSVALSQLCQNEPTYQDFMWRFEVQIARRTCQEQIQPTITMDFVLMKTKKFAENRSIDNLKSSSNNVVLSHINLCISDAKTASQCQNVISHVLLQCDLPNLIHMTNKLEQALTESKSHHVRKVQRIL